MSKPHVIHVRHCRNCGEQFVTNDRHMYYDDNCSYMETTQEWKERVNEQIEELVIS